MKKKIIAVIAGIIAGVITVGILESIGHLIFPPPEGMDLSDKDAMKSLMSEIPLGAQIAVLVAWFFGSLIAAITALKISGGDKMAGWIPVGVLLAFGIVTLFMIPHPVWMMVASVVLPLLAGWIAQKKFANP